MAVTRFRVNGKAQAVEADPGTPLLWVLHDHLGLTGTKFGCGIAQCGACATRTLRDLCACRAWLRSHGSLVRPAARS